MEDKEKSNAWEKYGEYFMNRTANDVMDEYSEQKDEWKNLTPAKEDSAQEK